LTFLSNPFVTLDANGMPFKQLYNFCFLREEGDVPAFINHLTIEGVGLMDNPFTQRRRGQILGSNPVLLQEAAESTL
jgi:hypothetical protein